VVIAHDVDPFELDVTRWEFLTASSNGRPGWEG
jgi:hypothetical protein